MKFIFQYGAQYGGVNGKLFFRAVARKYEKMVFGL